MLVRLLTAVARARSVPSKGWKAVTGKERRGYYKGKGAMKAGVHTRWGTFAVLPCMAPNYVVPDLKGFPLKPYVANSDATPAQAAGGAAAAVKP
jgi:large subunit ribosomal protein L41